MTTIIGLDLSLTAPGYFRRDALGHIENGVWKQTAVGMPRMNAIAKKVISLIPLGEEDQTLVVIEGFAYGAKGAAIYEIGGLGYIVRYALWHRGVQYVEVAPPTLKKYICGKGNVNKNIVIREVYKRWNVNAEDDNAADAFVLGRIGMNLAGIDQPTTEFQRQIIADLRKKARLVA
jgi:crossover junction endodeoxyribonuclease RuvC